MQEHLHFERTMSVSPLGCFGSQLAISHLLLSRFQDPLLIYRTCVHEEDIAPLNEYVLTRSRVVQHEDITRSKITVMARTVVVSGTDA